MTVDADILMITFDQPEYVRLSLRRLLDTCDESMRVWLWHNGDHEETLRAVESFLDHPSVHRFHHSKENQRVWAPTNWLWTEATGEFVSKVDDDCLLESGWAQKLADAHHSYDRFGALGCWRFLDEDFVPELSLPKIKEYPGGHRVLRNFWVQGSGYLLKRQCIERHGPLEEGQSFPQYCIKLSLAGWENGWYYPFLAEEHMDDPRSPHTRMVSDEALQRRLPLTAQLNGVNSLAAWQEQVKRSAYRSQAASLDPREYAGWRKRRKDALRRLKSMAGIKRKW